MEKGDPHQQTGCQGKDLDHLGFTTKTRGSPRKTKEEKLRKKLLFSYDLVLLQKRVCPIYKGLCAFTMFIPMFPNFEEKRFFSVPIQSSCTVGFILFSEAFTMLIPQSPNFWEKNFSSVSIQFTIHFELLYQNYTTHLERGSDEHENCVCGEMVNSLLELDCFGSFLNCLYHGQI